MPTRPTAITSASGRFSDRNFFNGCRVLQSIYARKHLIDKKRITYHVYLSFFWCVARLLRLSTPYIAYYLALAHSRCSVLIDRCQTVPSLTMYHVMPRRNAEWTWMWYMWWSVWTCPYRYLNDSVKGEPDQTSTVRQLECVTLTMPHAV